MDANAPCSEVLTSKRSRVDRMTSMYEIIPTALIQRLINALLETWAQSQSFSVLHNWLSVPICAKYHRQPILQAGLLPRSQK